ncbi:Multidrug resistance-associated protein 4, partial [Zootermopsis nevadensis]
MEQLPSQLLPTLTRRRLHSLLGFPRQTKSQEIASLYQALIMRLITQSLALTLTKTALRETTIGQAVNLMSNDVNRFDHSVNFFVYLWFGPLQTLVISYLMWCEIGFAAVIGVATIVLVIPLQVSYALLGNKITSENVRDFCVYGKQIILGCMIFSILRVLCGDRGVEDMHGYFNFNTEICGEVTTATRYVANDMKTTDLICDKSRSLGNECKMEMAKTGALEFNVYAEENSTDSGDTPDKNGLKVTNVMAVWTENLPENTLTDVSLEVRPGGLVAVIGPVGSEK